jgi:hypothetical protein
LYARWIFLDMNFSELKAHAGRAAREVQGRSHQEKAGIFANVTEEADLPNGKLSSGSFSSDEPLALRFRALLTEGGAERLELARA